MVAVDHADDPVDEVAEPVSELVVCPGDEAVDREVGVSPLGDLAQQPPADGVGPVLAGQVVVDAGSGNSLFSMVQMLAIALGVSIGGGLVNLFSAHLGSASTGFMLSFVCVGVITLLSALVFRRLDVSPVRPAVGARTAR